jgi:2-dehydro-3-deoxyphosphogluconate aldolase/(4S)-4-hydroxy-2-oxoglutarate aldolase
MPTGGVSPDRENLSAWFSAGVTCVGMGSQLISADILKNKAFDVLEQRVRDTLALIQELKNK